MAKQNNTPAKATDPPVFSQEVFEKNYANMSEDDKGNVDLLLSLAGTPDPYQLEQMGAIRRPEEEAKYEFEPEPYSQSGFEDFWDGFYNTAVVGTANGLANLVPTVAQALGSDAQIWNEWQDGVDNYLDTWTARTSDGGSFWADVGSGFGFVAPLFLTRGAGASRIARLGGKNSKLAQWFGNSPVGSTITNMANPLASITRPVGALARGASKTKVGQVASKAIGDPKSWFLATTQMYNDLRKEAKEMGMSDKDAARVSLLTAGIIGMTENFATEKLFKSMTTPAMKKLSSKSMENAIRAYGAGTTSQAKLKLFGKGIQTGILARLPVAGLKVGEGFGTEFIQEASQTYFEDIIQKGYDHIVLGTDEHYGGFDELASMETFKESMYNAAIGGIVGGSISMGGAIANGTQNEMLYGAINSAVKSNNPRNLEEISKAIDGLVAKKEITPEQATIYREEVGDMVENAKQANEIGIKDEVAHYQLWQLRQAEKTINDQVTEGEKIFTESNKLTVTESMQKAFDTNKKQAKKLTNVIEQKVNEIVESGKRDTSNPEKFDQLMNDIDNVYSMIAEKENPESIDKAIERLGVKHVRPERTEQVVPGVKSKPKTTETQKTDIQQPKQEEIKSPQEKLNEVVKQDLSKDQLKKIEQYEGQIKDYEAKKEIAETDEEIDTYQKKIDDKQAKIDKIKQSIAEPQKQEATKPVSAEEVPPTPKEEMTDFDRYVETGEVSDEMVANIADKISKGEVLTPEETAMREGVAERVEKKLQAKKEYRSKDEPVITQKGNVTEYQDKTGAKYKVQEGSVYDSQNRNISNTAKGREVLIKSGLEDGTTVRKKLVSPTTGRQRDFYQAKDGKIYIKDSRGQYSSVDHPEIKAQFEQDIDRGTPDSALEGADERVTPASSAIEEKISDIEKRRQEELNQRAKDIPVSYEEYVDINGNELLAITTKDGNQNFYFKSGGKTLGNKQDVIDSGIIEENAIPIKTYTAKEIGKGKLEDKINKKYDTELKEFSEIDSEEDSYDIANNESSLNDFLTGAGQVDPDLDTDEDITEKHSRYNNTSKTNDPGTQLEFSEITDYFKSIFPNISAKQVEKVTDKFGNRVLGRITKLGIEVDANQPFQIPLLHEYAHAYMLAKGGKKNMLIRQGMEMIKDTPYFKDAQRLYPELSVDEQAEEALAQAIAEKSYGKLKEKLDNTSMLNRFVQFAKRFWTSVKSLFSKNKQKQVLDIISNDFLNPKNSYQLNLGNSTIDAMYMKDSRVSDIIGFVNNEVIGELVKIVKNEVSEKNQVQSVVRDKVRSALWNQYNKRNKTDNMFTGIELQFDESRENDTEFNNVTTRFAVALSQQQPDLFKAFAKGMEQFLKTPTVKIEHDLEDKSNKANIKNDRKLSVAYQTIINNILDTNGDPISKSAINEYLAGLSQQSNSFIDLKKKLKADRNTNLIAMRLDDIIETLGAGYANPIAQQFNSIYIDRFSKSLIRPMDVVNTDINTNRDIEREAKKISDNISKLDLPNKPADGKNFIYRKRNKSNKMGNYYTDFIGSRTANEQTISFIKQHEFLRDRFHLAMKNIIGIDIDRDAFNQWLDNDAIGYNRLPREIYYKATGGKNTDISNVIGKLIARNKGGTNLVAQFISIAGNNENAIRPGAYMDRFNTQYIHNEEFQKRIDKSPYFGGYVLEYLKKTKQVEFTQLNGIENMNTGQIKEYTDQTSIDTVMRDMSNYMQSGNIYKQNTGVNGRGRTTAIVLPKRTSAQMEQDYKYQADLDQKILNEYISNNEINPNISENIDNRFALMKENYSRISFNEIVANLDGTVSVISPFEKEYNGDMDARLNEIVDMFTNGTGNVQTKFKENIFREIEIKDEDGNIIERIDDAKEVIKHFIKNDHIARHHIANTYYGAMVQKINTKAKVDPVTGQEILEAAKPIDADNIKRSSGATSTGEQEYIDKPIKYVVFSVPNSDTRDGAEKNMSDSMSIIGRSLYNRLLENHGELGGIGVNMKNVVFQVNPETGKQLFIKKSSIAATDLSQFDQHKDGNVLPDSGMVTWTNIQNIVDAVDSHFIEQDQYVEFIDQDSIKGQDLENVQAIDLSDPSFWPEGKLNSQAVIDAVSNVDSSRDIFNMSTTFDINVDYSKKSIEEIEATASTQLMSIAQSGVGVEGGITKQQVNDFQQVIVNKLLSDMGATDGNYSESRIVKQLMNDTEFLKSVRKNAIESDNEVIEQLTNQILERKDIISLPKKIKTGILRGNKIRSKVEALAKSYENINDKKGISLVSKLKEDIAEKRDTSATISELTNHGNSFNDINKFDWPSLKGIIEGTLSKQLSNAGLKLKMPGAYLHAIPDYGKNLNWYPREGKVRRLENGYIHPNDIPSVAVPWSMYANSLEEAQALKDKLESEGKYLRLNDVRVPASDRVSKFTARVDYFTDGKANTVVLPIEFIEASDSDHDGDKLFVYREPIKQTDTGIEIDTESVEYKLFNSLHDMLNTDYQIEGTRQNLKLDSLHKVADKLKAKAPDSKSLSKGIRDSASMNIIGERLSFATDAIGILALTGKLHNMLLRNGVSLGDNRLYLPVIQEDGSVTNIELNNFTSEQQEEIAKLLQSALDVVKDPVFVELGITKENIGVVKTLLMLGVDLETTLDFVNNEVLTEIVNDVKASTNIYTGEVASFKREFNRKKDAYEGKKHKTHNLENAIANMLVNPDNNSDVTITTSKDLTVGTTYKSEGHGGYLYYTPISVTELEGGNKRYTIQEKKLTGEQQYNKDVLNTFDQLMNLSENLDKLLSVIRLDSGLPNNQDSFVKIMEDIAELKSDKNLFYDRSGIMQEPIVNHNISMAEQYHELLKSKLVSHSPKFVNTVKEFNNNPATPKVKYHRAFESVINSYAQNNTDSDMINVMPKEGEMQLISDIEVIESIVNSGKAEVNLDFIKKGNEEYGDRDINRVQKILNDPGFQEGVPLIEQTDLETTEAQDVVNRILKNEKDTNIFDRYLNEYDRRNKTTKVFGKYAGNKFLQNIEVFTRKTDDAKIIRPKQAYYQMHKEAKLEIVDAYRMLKQEQPELAKRLEAYQMLRLGVTDKRGSLINLMGLDMSMDVLDDISNLAPDYVNNSGEVVKMNMMLDLMPLKDPAKAFDKDGFIKTSTMTKYNMDPMTDEKLKETEEELKNKCTI